MTQVKGQCIAFLQRADLFSHHLLTQQVVNFNDCIALQCFAKDEVDYPVGGVREEVEETEVFPIFAENNNKTALRQAQGPCPLRAKVVEPVETPTNNN